MAINRIEALQAAKDGLDVLPGLLPYTGARRRDSARRCVHACGKHHTGNIGLVGAGGRANGRVEETVDVFVGCRPGEGARLATRIRANVLMAELADVAVELLATHRATASADPGYGASWDSPTTKQGDTVPA